MRPKTLASVVTLVAFLATLVPVPAMAGPADPVEQTPNPRPLSATATGSSSLRASIDRAVREASAQPVALVQAPPSVRRAMQQGPGGGGSGMMIMSLVSVVGGLATTYFVMKEMRKQTDQARSGQ